MLRKLMVTLVAAIALLGLTGCGETPKPTEIDVLATRAVGDVLYVKGEIGKTASTYTCDPKAERACAFLAKGQTVTTVLDGDQMTNVKLVKK